MQWVTKSRQGLLRYVMTLYFQPNILVSASALVFDAVNQHTCEEKFREDKVRTCEHTFDELIVPEGNTSDVERVRTYEPDFLQDPEQVATCKDIVRRQEEILAEARATVVELNKKYCALHFEDGDVKENKHTLNSNYFKINKF